MREQEVRDLYEAYLQVHQPQEEEKLDEEAPERITKPTKNKRLMKDAGPARLHNPKNVDEEVEVWVNALVEEGYDLSEYTWDDMCEMYLDEARTDPRGRPASGPMSVYGGKGTPSPDPEGDDNVSRMERAQRRVKRTQPRAKGMAADALNTKYSARQTGRGGENPSPSDRTAQGHPHSPRRGGRSGRGAETDRGSGNAAQRRMSEDFDLFDTILEYLVAEGYADTNEAALKIMANMSEEWKQSIVEQDAIVRTGTSTNASGEKIPWRHTHNTGTGKSSVTDKFGTRDVTVRSPKLKGV